MDEYHFYMHRSPKDGRKNEGKHSNAKSKKKLMKSNNEYSKQQSKQNELCCMNENVLNSLHKLDEKQTTKAPYIDHKQIYEVQQVYGKNGKYTQYLITQYSEYDDCLSDVALPPIPIPIPVKKEEQKQIENNCSASSKMQDENEKSEVDDKLHEESHEPTTIDIADNYDNLKEDESLKSDPDKLRNIGNKTKSKRDLVSWMIYK